MRPATSVAALTAALLLAAVSSAQIPESYDAKQIPRYKLLRPGLAVAGRPTPEAMLELAALGFRTVINLATPTEPGVKEEEEVVRSLGLRYVSVPVTPQSFSPADVEAVEKVLDDPAALPILLHCGSSNRVGAVLAVIEVRKGRALDEAIEEGRKAGLSSAPMIEAVRRVVGEMRETPP